jgi:uncharacterized membrane protein
MFSFFYGGVGVDVMMKTVTGSAVDEVLEVVVVVVVVVSLLLLLLLLHSSSSSSGSSSRYAEL